MKSSVIRSACCSLRIPAGRPGSRVSDWSLRCPPVGPAGGRMILRAASASTGGGTNPKLVVSFGETPQKADGLECESHVR